MRNFSKGTKLSISQIKASRPSLKYLIKLSIKTTFLYFTIKIASSQMNIKYNYDILYTNNPMNDYLTKNILPIDYKPTIYLPFCLAQMIYNEKQTKKIIDYKRQYVATHDLGVISLDWVLTDKTTGNPLKYENLENDNKLLVIMHGLTGGSESNYIKDIISKFQEVEKLKIVVVNYRGISDSPLLTPFSYHCGYYQDLLTAMEFIREKYPNLRCYSLGTSMGANIFSKLLSNHHEFDDYIKGFISVSNPFNCHEVERRNRKNILNYFLVKRQKSYLMQHKKVFEHLFDYDKIKLIKKYRDFDEFFTCKLFGFKDADEYYINSSCIHDLNRIRIPTIFFNSRDDKLSPIDSLNLNKLKENEKFIMVLTRFGGHVSWFTGFRHPERWYLEKTKRYLEALDQYYVDDSIIDQKNIKENLSLVN